MNRRGALFGVTYRSVRTGRSEPVIVEAFSRGLDYFRPAAALYAGSVVWGRHDTMARPWVAFTVIGVLMAFSLLLLAFRRRTTWLLAIEVALAVGGIFATLLADHPEDVAAGQFTLPTIWAAGGVVGAAVLHGRLGGLVVAGVIATADLVEIGSPTQTTWHNILLLFLLGGLIGLAVDLARGGLHRYEQVLAERERLRERERLARVVHDGVLQTLAFIHRRGEEMGGEGAELGTLAAEQERTLRRMVSQDVTGSRLVGSVADAAGVVRRDLRLLLGAHEGERVSVSLPGGPVPFEDARAEELDAAVLAALDNVSATPATTPGPGCCSRTTETPSRSRCATTESATSPTTCSRLPPADGSASASRSSVVSATSAAPPTSSPDPAVAAGSSSPCLARSPHDREPTRHDGPRRRRPPPVAGRPRA